MKVWLALLAIVTLTLLVVACGRVEPTGTRSGSFSLDPPPVPILTPESVATSTSLPTQTRAAVATPTPGITPSRNVQPAGTQAAVPASTPEDMLTPTGARTLTQVPSDEGQPQRGSDPGTEATPTPEGTQTAATAHVHPDTGGDVVTVTYADGGVSPERIEIDAGQDVQFVNESDRPFWPASNIHPTHQVYSRFDPYSPLGPAESWSFTFDKAGFWRYHDHLTPPHGGLIVVRGEAAASEVQPLSIDPRELSFKEVGTLSVEDASNLFRDDDLLARYVKEYGPANTLRLLADSEARVNVDCHQRAHEAGRIAYEQFGALAFSLSGHECHSGGYHGATEALFRARGTANLEADIAVVCGSTLNTFFRHQCVHGVGHGLMVWTSYELLEALILCDRLEQAVDQQSCYSGIFMENVVGGLSGATGHFTEYLSEDPHFPCSILEERYMGPCYFFQTSRMLMLAEGDFQQVAKGCVEAPQAARRLCLQSMGRDVGGVSRGNPEQAIHLCSYAEDRRDRRDCLGGAVQDTFWDASGSDNALAFCGLVQDEEKNRCYSTIIARAHHIFGTPQQLQVFCDRIGEEYRKGCP